MMYIMEKALATKAVWNFNKGDIYDGTADDGRGAFNRLAIQMMHDVDARFGYIKKTAGNRYKLSDPVGHANDALAFLNDDGVTGEIYDTLLGEGAVAKDRLTWGFKGRSEGERDRWMYPIG